MNKHVKNLYVVILENKVLYAATTHTDFYRYISGIVSGVKSMSYYQKEFAKESRIKHTDIIGKTYYFQKVK